MKRHLEALGAAFDIFRENGLKTVVKEGKWYAWRSLFRFFHSVTNKSERGQPIYDERWDLLVILDACRVDAVEEVKHEYEFINEIEKFVSLGSNSKEWMLRNFNTNRSKKLGDTIYVTGNPFSDELLDKEDWQDIIEVWKTDWDEEEGTIQPRPLTNVAVSVAREKDPCNMIVHYMQPHTPFVGFENSSSHSIAKWNGKGYDSKTEWQKVRDGELEFELAWDGYVDNLRHVLDDVEVLLKNVDAENVIITADHGECVGEWGLFGHPEGIAVDPLREVPLIRTSATDDQTFQPQPLSKNTTISKEEQLEALGYK